MCFFAQTPENPSDYKQSSEFRRLANESFIEGNFTKSIELYNKSIALNPSAETYYRIAKVYLASGNNLDSDISVYNKILDLSLD